MHMSYRPGIPRTSKESENKVGKNRWKKEIKLEIWNFQIKKMIVLVRKLTWTWPSTSTTHSLPQCALQCTLWYCSALCTIKNSQEMVIIPSFHHPITFFYIPTTSIPFASIYPIHPSTNPWNILMGYGQKGQWANLLAFFCFVFQPNLMKFSA